jgi:hypothetical protein
MGTVSDREAQLDRALGYMVRRAAMTEFFLQQTIKELIRSRYAPLVTASLPAAAALDAIQRIVDTGGFGDETPKEFRRIADIARAAFGERNKYVHGVRIAIEDRDLLLIRNRRKGGFDGLMAEVDELDRLGEEFRQLSGMIVEWRQNYIGGKSKAAPFEVNGL